MKRPGIRSLSSRNTFANEARRYAASVPIRLVLADDHYLIREGVAALIATEDDLELVATCDARPSEPLNKGPNRHGISVLRKQAGN